MRIGPYVFDNNVALAPMAGITDRPFRTLCKQLGAGWTVSEMVTARPDLRNSKKTQLRLRHGDGSTQPHVVQIVGADPSMLAEAARFNVDNGAHIIDINMGCPAKKVCNVASGSALMRDEVLVGRILEAVVNAVDAPVTLKTRTGWAANARNGVAIAKIAEQSGIQALAMHGRTREDKYKGEAEYETIAETKMAVNIPVIANGDITSPQKAQEILTLTGADAVMVGRGAQGQPWLPGHIAHYLNTGEILANPSPKEVQQLLLNHLTQLHVFYGEYMGVRISRKHIAWYLQSLNTDSEAVARQKHINRAQDAKTQMDLIDEYFNHQNANATDHLIQTQAA